MGKQSIILNEKQIQNVILQGVYDSNITIARKDFGTASTNKVAGNYMVTKIPNEPFKLNVKSKNDTLIVNNSYPVESCEDNGGTVIEIEWWYQTYVNGVLIYEEYIYSTYECWGVGGVGGGSTSPTPEELCQIRLEAFENQGGVTSQLLSTLITYEDAFSMKVVYNWKIYSAYTWGLISYEDAEITKIPTRGGYLNEYSSFTHRLITSIGISVGGSRTFKDLGASINKTQTRAQVRIDFKVTHSPTGCIPGIPILHNNTREFRIFNSVTIE